MKRFVVFECRKCGHNLYVENTDDIVKEIGKVSNSDCPSCGEEPDGNWVLVGLDNSFPYQRDRKEQTMSKDKQNEFERNEIAEIIAENFRLNDEKYDASDFEWSAHCVQMAGYRKQEWISVEERLPEERGMYLIYNPSRMVSKVVTARYSKNSNRWCSADACCYHEGITHWMPLPMPPKGDGKDDRG